MQLNFDNFSAGNIIAIAVLSGLGILLLILGLSRLWVVPFTEEEALNNLKDWISLPELKALIEKTKNGRHISGHDLRHFLIDQVCKKKVTSKIFVPTDEDRKKFRFVNYIEKYKLT